MFIKIQKRMKGEKGFTLIELLVVIIIIAILAAIAIPTFLGQRQKAQDAAAKSLVRNAMTALESAYVDARTYDVPAADVAAIEPSIHFTKSTNNTIADGTTSVLAAPALASAATVDFFGGANDFAIGATSASNNVFAVYTNKGASGATTFVKKIGTTISLGW